MAFDDHPCPEAGKFWWFLLGFAPADTVCFILGLFLGRWTSLWLTCCCSLRDWLLSTQAYSPSAALIQMCQIRLRGKPPGLLLICAIMEFQANKLSWLTVTVQWLGSTSVTWPWGASSLSEAIMRKWSFAIELCNDKYWLISALIGWFNCVIGVWAYRVASNCSVVMCFMIHSFDFVSTLFVFVKPCQTHTNFDVLSNSWNIYLKIKCWKNILIYSVSWFRLCLHIHKVVCS